MIFGIAKKIKGASNLWKARGGGYVLLSALVRVFPLQRMYRRWANAISRSELPRTLVSLSGVYTNQAWTERTGALEDLAKKYLSGPFVAMEIGTWFGEGSTRIWTKQLQQGSKLFLVDIWGEYISGEDKAQENAYSAMDSVHHIAINSVLKMVYDCERNSPGDIYVLRGKASSVCNFFKANIFDLIYIDGSHYYEDVVEDIRLAKSLLKDGGVICGDDLELTPNSARVELAKQNLHRDFIKSEADGSWFHPGVLLAVSEHFPSVINRAGIWSVVKRGDTWAAI